MFKAAKYFLILFAAFFIFTTCKKYPENRLWFKNPEKAFKGGRIQYLNVDGADSLTYFSSYFGFDFRNEFIEYDSESNDLNSSHMFGDLSIKKKSKNAYLYLRMNSSVTNYTNSPLFTLNNSTSWEIIKLTRKSALKLRTIKNGKSYEILLN